MVKQGVPAELYIAKWGDRLWSDLHPEIVDAISSQQGWDTDDVKIEHLAPPVVQMRKRWEQDGYKD